MNELRALCVESGKIVGHGRRIDPPDRQRVPGSGAGGGQVFQRIEAEGVRTVENRLVTEPIKIGQSSAGCSAVALGREPAGEVGFERLDLLAFRSKRRGVASLRQGLFHGHLGLLEAVGLKKPGRPADRAPQILPGGIEGIPPGELLGAVVGVALGELRPLIGGLRPEQAAEGHAHEGQQRHQGEQRHGRSPPAPFVGPFPGRGGAGEDWLAGDEPVQIGRHRRRGGIAPMRFLLEAL